ncbi:glycoside hydrolase domain-containing protein [candidate division KSB1 bacterium]
MKTRLLIACLALMGISCGSEGEFQAWPQSIEVRTYPGAFSREPDVRDIHLTGLAGETVSAQVVVKNTRNMKGLSGIVTDLRGQAGAIGSGLTRVRYGAYLPVDETMVLTSDPLLETAMVDVPANTAQPVWLTITVPSNAAAGEYVGELAVAAKSSGSATFKLTLEVLPASLPEPPDWSFYLNVWQDPSGVARAHKVEEWSEEHFELLEKYASNFAAHGMNTITTSIVHDPWESQSGYPFATMVEWKYPGEYTNGNAEKFTWGIMAGLKLSSPGALRPSTDT